jgi:uncharacterized protein involved in exopolysaccharide biosynthesis
MSTGVSLTNGCAGQPVPEQKVSDGFPSFQKPVPIGAARFAATVRLLWKARIAITLIAMIVTTAGVVFSLLTPPRYESTTRLLPAPHSAVLDGATQMMRPEMGALAGLAGLSNLGRGEERFVPLLKSRIVADRIIARFNLMKLYASHYRHEARTALANHTIIQQDRKTEVIAITFRDRSPERAAQIAQAYVQELEKFNAEMNTSGAHMEKQFLQERVKEVDDQLQEAVSRLSDFSTASRMLDPQMQPRSTVDEAMKIEAQVVTLKAELSGEEQIYRPETLIVPRAKLAELERHLSLIQGTHGDGSLPSIHSLPKLGSTFANLGRRAKLLEVVELYLTQKLELAKTEEVKQLPVFSVMEPAEIPEQRVWPRRRLIILASVVLGMLAGTLFVLGKAKWYATEFTHPIKALLLDLSSGRTGKKAV